MSQKNSPTLNPELAQQLIEAVRSINQLRSQTIVTKTRDEQILHFTRFIESELPKHANELLGCWIFANVNFPQLVKAFRYFCSLSGVALLPEQVDNSVPVLPQPELQLKTPDGAA